MAGNKTKTRRFSYTDPIMFQGSYYPTAEWDIQSDTGEVNPSTVFAAPNGSYYTLDSNGSAIPVMPFHNLDEVNVTAPKKQDVSANAFSRYLTMSNDNTQVNNLPHREYNTHLKENAEKGAKEHALWEKEHPNLTAWGEVAGAIPFGVASIPLIAGTSQTLLGTATGQAVKSGITKALANPLVELANNAVGLGFAGKGAYDVSQGKFTPETAMDLAGGVGLMFKSLTGLDKARRAKKTSSIARQSEEIPPIDQGTWEDVDLGELSSYNPYPLEGKTEIPMNIKADAAQRYTNFINSKDYQSRLQRAGLEDHWSYMKKLTKQKVRNGHFPGIVKEVIDNSPNILGQSDVNIRLPKDKFPYVKSNPDYGINLKENLYPEDIFTTINHELAHFATGNRGINGVLDVTSFFPNWRKLNAESIGDIMKYNEGIAPNISWEEKLKRFPKTTSIDDITEAEEDYRYLIDPQEKRARAYSILQQAKEKNMSTDAFVDAYTENDEIVPYAPRELQAMGNILTLDNLKKYLRNFLSVGIPIGITTPYIDNKNK
jgi:hypothetical protein